MLNGSTDWSRLAFRPAGKKLEEGHRSTPWRSRAASPPCRPRVSPRDGVVSVGDRVGFRPTCKKEKDQNVLHDCCTSIRKVLLHVGPPRRFGSSMVNEGSGSVAGYWTVGHCICDVLSLSRSFVVCDHRACIFQASGM